MCPLAVRVILGHDDSSRMRKLFSALQRFWSFLGSLFGHRNITLEISLVPRLRKPKAGGPTGWRGRYGTDPFIGVRQPVRRNPGGRSAAAAVEEPDE